MWLPLLIGAIGLLVFWIKWSFSYWKRKGFPYEEPHIPFGALDSVWKREKAIGMAIYDVHKSHKESVVGIYLGPRPALLIRDAQLARDVLEKNFSSFHDRGVYVDEERDPMSGSLFFLKGKKWKTMRTKLAPAFTSGKLKAMLPKVLDISNAMITHLNTVIPDDGSAEVELTNITTTYAVDIIASSIFGLDVNSFEEPKNEFNTIRGTINVPTLGNVLRGGAQFLWPQLEKLCVRLGWKEEAPERMNRLVRQTIELREKHNIVRKDMLQLLLQLRNTGEVNADDKVWSADTNGAALSSITIDAIAAQLYLFYIAGFETSSSATSFTMYELSQYPEVLAKAQEDVRQALEKHGSLTYEALADMKYLDLCFMETVRKYPGLPILNRECTEDFVIPELNKTITKGTPIVISLFGIHRDEEYFPSPLKYDPERFLEENMRYNPIAYMPFGEGPRHCIAQRSGKVNVKVALAQILSNFNVETRDEVREIEIDNFGIPIMPKGGVFVRLSKRKH